MLNSTFHILTLNPVCLRVQNGIPQAGKLLASRDIMTKIRRGALRIRKSGRAERIDPPWSLWVVGNLL